MILKIGLFFALLSSLISTFFFGSIVSETKMFDENGKFTHTFIITSIYTVISFFCACYIGSLLSF